MGNTWDLSPLLKNDEDRAVEDYRKTLHKKCYAFINKWKDRNDYLKTPKVLKQALDEYEELARYYFDGGKEGFYFTLRGEQEQDNPKIKAKSNKVNDFWIKIENDMQFFTIRIAKIDQKLQSKFLKYSGLKPYKHFLETSFEVAKHLLGEPEEKVANLLGKTAYADWVNMTEEFLSKEERTIKNNKKNFSEIMSLVDHADKSTRDEAAEALNDIYLKNINVAETEINSVLHYKKVNDELRKFSRPDSATILADDLEPEVVDTLAKVVTESFDISKKYYELKAKLFKVKKLEYHERNVPYGKIDKHYSYEEAKTLLNNTLKQLDSKFSKIFEMFVKNDQLDVFPKKGKRSGAACYYDLISLPTYIILNYAERLKDVLTVAHEVGHGINSELMKEKQNALNFGTTLSTAEVASTFVENFTLQEIMRKEEDEELKLALMMDQLNTDVSTIQRQIACHNFQQELHKEFREKGFLSKEEIGKMFQKHMQSYMGNYVEQSPGSENWWVSWSHIRAYFYNYQYASGLLLSKAMQHAFKENNAFINKIKEFLSTGDSESPKAIFKKMGIDITKKSFWQQGVSEVRDLLEETEKLAKKLGKI